MSEWVSALIGAGSAVAGGIATGWFTRNAGHRQAAAAEHAGNRQADALISTVQANLDEQRRAKAAQQRRQTYAQMLAAGEQGRGNSQASDTPMMLAIAQVELEGPQEVIDAALAYKGAIEQMNEHWNEDHHDILIVARTAFIHAAQNAIRDA